MSRGERRAAGIKTGEWHLDVVCMSQLASARTVSLSVDAMQCPDADCFTGKSHILGIWYGLNVLVSSKFTCWNPLLQELVIIGGACGKRLSHESPHCPCSWVGLVPLSKMLNWAPSSLLSCEGTVRRHHLWTESKASPDTQTPEVSGTLFYGFSITQSKLVCIAVQMD